MNMELKKIFEDFFCKKSAGEYDCGQGAVMYMFCCDECPSGESLFMLLSPIGAKLVAEYEVDSLRAFSFLLKDRHIYVYYSEAEKLLRVVSDPNKNLPLSERTVPDGKCAVRFWQFEVDHSLIDCGMCYLFQLSDYSFFVIDSAHVYSVNDDIRLYSFMRERTPESLPVRVAGWFFSHGHSDHIVKFLDILRYNKNIEIDGLYFNIAPTDHFSSADWDESEIHHAEEFIELTDERADIPKYTLHSGQRFFVKDLEICVLCTHEDVFPNSLENYNDTSTVIKINVAGNTVILPGDAGGEESRILETRFTDFLACDILQVAHHGHFGLSPEFYRRANAHVVLFPTTKIKYDEEFPRYEANRIAVALSKHVFIASDGTVEFSFPLGGDIKLLPDETFENFEGIKTLWNYDYSEDFKNRLKARFADHSKADTVAY